MKTNKPPFLEISKEGFELIFQAAPTDNGLAMKILKALYTAIYEDTEPKDLNIIESLVYKSVSDASKRRYESWLRKTSNLREHNPRSKEVEEPQITVSHEQQ